MYIIKLFLKIRAFLIIVCLVFVLAPTPLPTPSSFNPKHADLVAKILLEHPIKMSTQQKWKLAHLIVTQCEQMDCDPLLIAAIISVESQFEKNAISQKGAMGLMQLLPFVGKDVAKTMGLSWEGQRSLLDEETNIKMGIFYFNKLQKRFKGNIKIALAAYNWGPSAISNKIKNGHEIPHQYHSKVTRLYNQWLERKQS